MNKTLIKLYVILGLISLILCILNLTFRNEGIFAYFAAIFFAIFSFLLFIFALKRSYKKI
ncbi:hypothetical protein [Clostridium tarantellae]|uniref:Uncharacterized protein n=1 Tax=Clostridium tarantellae TaxID=39493 RepID=A0A6I1MKK4_9CLOT|nr:hypothetical protein [Clostridium tarantellae]MPQ43243.1 hypothetical protein [Clostridium tarantellae]